MARSMGARSRSQGRPDGPDDPVALPDATKGAFLICDEDWPNWFRPIRRPRIDRGEVEADDAADQGAIRTVAGRHGKARRETDRGLRTVWSCAERDLLGDAVDRAAAY